MKQVLSLCLTLCFSLLSSVKGNEHKIIDLTFNKNDFSLVKTDGLYSIYSDKWDISFDSNPNTPALPYVVIKVLLPTKSEYIRIDSEMNSERIASGISIRPNIELIPTDDSFLSSPTFKEINYTEPKYPQESTVFTGSYDVRGFSFVSFRVYPFTYESDNGSLFLNSSVTLDIEYKSMSKSAPASSDFMCEYIQGTIVNKEDFPLWYGTKNSSTKHTGEVITHSSEETSWSDYPTKYLIVTNELLKPAFEKLARWKTMKGVKTEVITVEEIMNNYNYGYMISSEDSAALNIKYAIYDYWTRDNIEYVLLGGDLDIVPSRTLWIYYQAYHGTNPMEELKTPGDVYYSSFEDSDMTWSGNTSNSDDIRCTPQLCLSRLAVSTLSQAYAQINRIIEYERNPITDTWNCNILMSGSLLNDYSYIGSRRFSDADMQSDAIWNRMNSSLWNRFKLFDTSTSYPVDSLYQVSAGHLLETVANGFSFIYMNTHGKKSHWCLEEGNFDLSHAASFYNPMKSIILTSACLTNAIDTICLSKTLMKNPNSGVLAYWGSSRSGWSAPISYNNGRYTVLDGSQKYDSTFLHLMISSADCHLGRIAMQTKIEMMGHGMGPDKPNRWLHYAINLLGDPEMPIYIKEPKEILKFAYYESDVLHIEISDDAYYDQETRDKLRVCVMSLGDGGHSYYWTQNLGHIRSDWIEIPPIDCSVCITQPGFKPKVFNILRSGYLQNEILEGETYCISNTLTAGRDVTNLKPQGNVVIKNGSAKFFSPNGTTIQNYFEVQKGATLIIDPSGEYEGIDNPWYDYLQDD